MAAGETIQGFIDTGDRLSAYCHKCNHHQQLDLLTVRACSFSMQILMTCSDAASPAKSLRKSFILPTQTAKAWASGAAHRELGVRRNRVIRSHRQKTLSRLLAHAKTR